MNLEMKQIASKTHSTETLRFKMVNLSGITDNRKIDE